MSLSVHTAEFCFKSELRNLVWTKRDLFFFHSPLANAVKYRGWSCSLLAVNVWITHMRFVLLCHRQGFEEKLLKPSPSLGASPTLLAAAWRFLPSCSKQPGLGCWFQHGCVWQVRGTGACKACWLRLPGAQGAAGTQLLPHFLEELL